MEDLHVTLIPCRAVRIRNGLIVLSGVSNLVPTGGSLPYVLPRTAAFVRLMGKRVKGTRRFSVNTPSGRVPYEEFQEVPPFDALGISETWFGTNWLALRELGRYNLRLELDGRAVLQVQVLVVD